MCDVESKLSAKDDGDLDRMDQMFLCGARCRDRPWLVVQSMPQKLAKERWGDRRVARHRACRMYGELFVVHIFHGHGNCHDYGIRLCQLGSRFRSKLSCEAGGSTCSICFHCASSVNGGRLGPPVEWSAIRFLSLNGSHDGGLHFSSFSSQQFLCPSTAAGCHQISFTTSLARG